MGEEPRSIGIEAENKAWNFLRALGYEIKELNNEEYDIDCLAEFPPSITKYRLLRPRYSPEGLTAYEITAGMLRERKIRRFAEKIAKYNKEHEQNQINGGVLLVDEKISPQMSATMEREKIYGWGSNRHSFYQEKIRIFNTWKEQYGPTAENQINNETTYLRCSTPPPTKFDKLLYFAVFFDDHVHKLSAKTVKDIMYKIRTDSIVPLIECGIIPIHAYFEFHALGGVSDLREDVWKYVIEPWRGEGIIVFTPKEPFKNYRAFPALP